jgi:hypothetical protein
LAILHKRLAPIVLMLASAFSFASIAFADEAQPVPEIRSGVLKGYLPQEALPDSLALLPPPPAVGSAAPGRDPGRLKGHEGVRRYAVLDDDDDELDALPLFQPSAATGLSEEIAGGMIDFLLGKTDRDMRRNRVERLFQNVLSALRGHRG